MPPKAKFSEDGNASQSLEKSKDPRSSVNRQHRKAFEKFHLKNIVIAEDAARTQEGLEVEREREREAASSVADLGIPTFSVPGVSLSSASLAKSEEEIEMWNDYAANGAKFTAGDNIEDPRMRHEQLGKEADSLGIWNADAVTWGLGLGNVDVAQDMLAEDEEEDFLSEIMCNAGIDEPDAAEIQAGDDPGTAGPSPDSKFFPYPNETIFLLDILDNLPRLRISGSLMRVILWMLKQGRCKDVPSFALLRRIQKSIRSECGIPTIPCKSVQGNVFFMNDPAAIITQDWANPQSRKDIHVYPEIPTDGIIREIWHAQKWRVNMDLDVLSPMYDSGSSHYYVNEVARLKSGIFVVPIRWVIFEDKVHADVFSIAFNERQEATIIETETTLISSEEFQDNFLDLEHTNEIPTWSEITIQAGHSIRMPNPKCVIAGGDPLYCSMVDYFSDDVSGNRTKSWNKHWNAYMTHCNLPRQLLQQEFHVHFISTSPKASVTERFKEFKARVEATHTEPVKVCDETGTTTRFCLHVNSGPSDNPMQSEIVGRIGGKHWVHTTVCGARKL
ncbi:hypothetical protein C8F04DRAFT_1192873 [Mycena alexandri]|uniref:Uncharacterized protein n=1 Tax=Mycena alexandri TaxID=1745969 RepID=A0AAD6SAP0_9AGAR|nr:hypothetical protein C8F04DRAFT_1192873 [Mycena alexandri]